MGFLERIEQDNTNDEIMEMELLVKEEARRQDVASMRDQIVADAVKAFAKSLGFESLELTSSKHSGRYFLVGDLVLVVRLHGHIDKKKLGATARAEVLWQHSIALVGLDITSRLAEVGRGTLRTVSYEGIRNVFNTHRNLEFSNSSVISVLTPKETAD